MADENPFAEYLTTTSDNPFASDAPTTVAEPPPRKADPHNPFADYEFKASDSPFDSQPVSKTIHKPNPLAGLPIETRLDPDAPPPVPPPTAMERYRASRPDWTGFNPLSGASSQTIKPLQEELALLGLGGDVLRGTLKGHPLQGETAREFFHADEPMLLHPGDWTAHLASAIRAGAGMMVDPTVLARPAIGMLKRLSGMLKGAGGSLPSSIAPGSTEAKQLLMEGPPGSIQTGQMVWTPKMETEKIPIPGRLVPTQTERRISDALSARQTLQNSEATGEELPQWYQRLIKTTQGTTDTLTREQIDKSLYLLAKNQLPKHSQGRAYRLVKDAIGTEPTAEEAIPGGVMLNPVDRGSWSWVENPTVKPPTSPRAVFDAPAEVVTSSPNPIDRASRWNRWWDAATSKLSPDIPLLRNIPNSPVISVVEQLKVKPELALSELEREPWFERLTQTYKGDKGNEIGKDLEAQAVDFYRLKGGGALNEHLAVQTLPEDLQMALKAQDEELALENQLREELGYPLIRRKEGPYFPRIVKSDMPRGEHFFTDIEALLNESPGKGTSPLQTTLAGHEKHAVYQTMREGEAEKLVYEHFLRAMIHRKVEGVQMRATLEMLRALKQDGVLWPTEAEALAASPNGTVARMGHLWVRSKQEADFLAANLKEVAHNPLSAWFNTYLRNPSLIIPYPHIINNMGMKYLLARVSSGQFKGFWSDLKLYKDHRELVPPEEQALFDKLLPFSDTAIQVRQRMNNLVPSGEVGDFMASAVGKLNNWSATKIFKEYDPAMRYALWKSYLRGGMEPQDAANHVWKDLVRYNIRSSWGDYLKTWVGNFFVPWRIGTWETTLRHMYSAPVKTALFIGLFDYLREMDYRKTGNYTHMFWDYIERPIVTAVTHPSQAPRVAIMTAALGPEGENTVMGLKRLFEVADGSADWNTVKHLMWGFAQTTGMMKEFEAAIHAKTPTDAAGHFTNIAMRFFISRHPVIFKPPALWEGLPEGLPGMEKSPAVRQQESQYGLWQERKAIKDQRKQMMRELRP